MITIYKNIETVLKRQRMVCEIGMNRSQSNLLNGFKRMFKHRAKNYYELSLTLSNVFFDKHNKELPFVQYHEVFDKDNPSFNPMDFPRLMNDWFVLLSKDLAHLGKINHEYFEKTGLIEPASMEAAKLMEHDKIKAWRWFKGYDMGDMAQVFSVDAYLYAKYKAIEGD